MTTLLDRHNTQLFELTAERYEFENRKKFTDDEKKVLLKQGHAIVSPATGKASFPIRPGSLQDIKNAAKAVGLGAADDDTIKAHIKKHWEAAGKPTWSGIPAWLVGDDERTASRIPVTTRSASKPRRRTTQSETWLEYGEEQRAYGGTIELRSTGKNTAEISGYVCRWNAPYKVFDGFGPTGYFTETMHRGLTNGTDMADALALIGHNRTGVPLGRMSNGTLRVSEDNDGLAYTMIIDQRTNQGNDVLCAVDRGDLTGASIGMLVGRDKWNAAQTDRDIFSMRKMLDVSLVGHPAATGTSADLGGTPVARSVKYLSSVLAEQRSGKTISKATHAKIAQAVAHVQAAGVNIAASHQHLLDLIGDGTVTGNSGPPKGLGNPDGSGSRFAVPELQRGRTLRDIQREQLEWELYLRRTSKIDRMLEALLEQIEKDES